MEGNKRVLIHQALHGYSDGHGLLASSCELTSDEKRTINELSDLSGSFSEIGFKPYLTGYPLPGGNYYALARTWQANEMKRPGCVWTHTLLISLSTLGRLNKLQALFDHFKRPKIDSYSEFTNSIEFDNINKESINQGLLDHSATADILTYLLYQESDKAIVVNGLNNDVVEEDIIFKIWNQQWPRLRRSFTFCTNVSIPRYLHNKIFDLQFTNTSKSKFHDTRAEQKIHLVNNLNNTSIAEDWFKMFKETKLNDLLPFMYKYGSDVAGLRKNYIPLFYAFQVLNSNDFSSFQLSHILNFFKQYFPETEEAKSLKIEMVERLFQSDIKQQYYFFLALLENKKNLKGFIDLKWDYLNVVKYLWENKIISKLEISTLFKKMDENLFGEGVEVLLSKIPLETWINNKWITEEILLKVLDKNILLASEKTIWTSNQATQKKWFKSIFGNNKNFEDRGYFEKIIHSMISSNNDFFVEKLEGICGSKIIKYCLSYIKNYEAELPEKWKELVFLYPHESISELQSKSANIYTLDLFLELYLKSKHDFKKVKSKAWIDILSNFENLPFTQNKSRLYSIILASTFLNQLDASPIVCSLVFQKIHDESAKSNIEGEIWDVLLKSIPQNQFTPLKPSGLITKLFWFNDNYVPSWDKCEILRRGIVQCYIEYQWDPKYLFQTVTNLNTFKSIAIFCSKTKEGQSLIASIKMNRNSKYKDYLRIIDDLPHH